MLERTQTTHKKKGLNLKREPRPQQWAEGQGGWGAGRPRNRPGEPGLWPKARGVSEGATGRVRARGAGRSERRFGACGRVFAEKQK